MVERLSATRPETLDHASRIRGVTPAALAALHFQLVKRAA
jgi:tRNA uridine 5-carboxymethylaminomethyl modification enzyme